MKKAYRYSLILLSILFISSTANSAWDQFSNSGGGEWLYRKAVTINNAGAMVNDYQVLIDGSQLGISELLGEGKIQSDTKDARFATGESASSELYYSETSPLGNFWVNVPILDTGDNVIYFYYGNSNATSSSDGPNTFLMYNDFNDNIDGWTNRGGGPANWKVLAGFLDIYDDDIDGRSEITAPQASHGNVELMYKTDYFAESSGKDGGAMLRQSSTGQGYRFSIFNDSGNMGIYRTDGWRDPVPTILNETAFSMTADTYYQVKIIAWADQLKVKCWENGQGEPGTWTLEVTDSMYPAGEFAGLTGAYYAPKFIYYEDFRVRKYTEPEPVTSGVGTEEAATSLPPDLRIVSMTLLTPSPQPGQTAQMQIDIVNQGAGHALTAFWVDFYRNMNADPYPGSPGDYYEKIDYLYAGSSTTVTADFTYEGGDYNSYAQVDTEDSINEINESNNIYGPVQINQSTSTSRLYGKIYNNLDSTEFIQGATISLLQDQTEVASDITDFEGKYSMHVEEGLYDIEVIANTYLINNTNSYMINSGDQSRDFGLIIDPTTGVLFGRITREDGITPISGALVEAWEDAGMTFRIDVDSANVIGQYRLSVNESYPTCSMRITKDGYDEVRINDINVSFDNMLSQNIQLVMTQTGPEPVDELYPTLMADRKVRLDWLQSLSADVNGYNVYYYYGNNLDYSQLFSLASLAETVPSAQTYWESPTALERGENYFFSVRPVNSSGDENLDLNMVVNLTVANNPGDLKAVIKVPRTGRKVVGGRISVIAEVVAGDTGDVEQVLFEYKPSHYDTWVPVPAVTGIQNPDTQWPYFVILDLSDDSVFPNGNYDLRAVAYSTDGNPDPQPATIMVSKNSVDYDIKEEIEEVNNMVWHKKEEKIYQQRDNVVKAGSARTDKLTEVRIPRNALDDPNDMLIIRTNEDDSAASATGLKRGIASTNMPVTGPLASLVSLDEFRDIELASGQFTFTTGNELEITIPYSESNLDNAEEEDIQIWSYSNNGPWVEEEDFRVNTDSNTVIITTNHLSIFALYAPALGTDLSNAYAFPSPFISEEHTEIQFVNLSGDCTIKIYNIAGELVFTEADYKEPFFDWDVKNDDGEKVASGVYIYVITDTDNNMKREKIAIIR